jgi:hypothetical protein
VLLLPYSGEGWFAKYTTHVKPSEKNMLDGQKAPKTTNFSIGRKEYDPNPSVPFLFQAVLLGNHKTNPKRHFRA